MSIGGVECWIAQTLNDLREHFIREVHEMHCSNMRPKVKKVNQAERSHRSRSDDPEGNNPAHRQNLSIANKELPA